MQTRPFHGPTRISHASPARRHVGVHAADDHPAGPHDLAGPRSRRRFGCLVERLPALRGPVVLVRHTEARQEHLSALRGVDRPRQRRDRGGVVLRIEEWGWQNAAAGLTAAISIALLIL